MFIVTLFKMIPKWKQLKYLLTDKWMNQVDPHHRI